MCVMVHVSQGDGRTFSSKLAIATGVPLARRNPVRWNQTEARRARRL